MGATPPTRLLPTDEDESGTLGGTDPVPVLLEEDDEEDDEDEGTPSEMVEICDESNEAGRGG